jgi:hypothetical protein
MGRWIRWLGSTMLTAAIVCGLTLYMTWTVVNTYVEQVLAQFHIDTREQKMQFSEFLTNMAGSMNIMKKADPPTAGYPSARGGGASASAETGGNVQPADSGTFAAGGNGMQPSASPGVGSGAAVAPADGSGSSDSVNPAQGAPTGTGQKQTKPEDAVAVWGTGISAEDKSGKTTDSQKLVISAEEFNRKKDLISDDDKMSIFSLLVKSVPAEQMQQLSQIAEDGVTTEELTQVQSLVERYMQPNDYKELLAILNKYK